MGSLYENHGFPYVLEQGPGQKIGFIVVLEQGPGQKVVFPYDLEQGPGPGPESHGLFL